MQIDGQEYVVLPENKSKIIKSRQTEEGIEIVTKDDYTFLKRLMNKEISLKIWQIGLAIIGIYVLLKLNI